VIGVFVSGTRSPRVRSISGPLGLETTLPLYDRPAPIVRRQTFSLVEIIRVEKIFAEQTRNQNLDY
jgi:hypothetical protein